MMPMAIVMKKFNKYWPADLHLIGKRYFEISYDLLANSF